MPSQIYADQTFDKCDATNMYALILGTQEPNSTVDRCAISSNGCHWSLKMPGNIGSVISDTTITGGTYRALDMVQCRGQRFNRCVFGPGKDRAAKITTSKWKLNQTCDIGIKGSSQDIQFNGCTMTDMLLGDHDIYDNPQPALPFLRGGVGPKVVGIVLTDCVHPAGKGTSIILRVLNAEMPKLVNTNAVALVYLDGVVKTYFWVAGKWIDSRTRTV